MKRISTTLALMGIAWVFPWGWLSAQVPVGSEFQVNTYTTDRQRLAKVAMDAEGNFVVVWMSEGSGGSDTLLDSIQGQRYGSDGDPRGSEFQINTYTPNRQVEPDIAVAPSGEFVVTWTSMGSLNGDYSGRSVQAQRYTSEGNPQGAQFIVNTYTTYNQWYSSVDVDSEGNFVVAWQSTGTYLSIEDIKAQRFSSDGSSLGSEFQVNTYTTSYQWNPEVGVMPNGDFVVVWASRGSFGGDTSGFSIQGRRYASNGSSQGSQFQINSYTEGYQLHAEVAVSSEGDFTVVWNSAGSNGGDTSGLSIQAQRFDSGGSAVGPQFQVNAYTTNSQNFPVIAIDDSGNFMVSWQDNGAPEAYPFPQSVQGRHFSSQGIALGPQFTVNSYTTGNQNGPALAAGPRGNFVVTWFSYGSNGTDDGSGSVQGQRVRGLLFADGFESGDTSVWSAVSP